MLNGAIRHLHVNHLRQFKIGVNGVEIIFEDETDKFGSVEYCETGVGGDEESNMELSTEKLEAINGIFNQ